MNQLQDIPNEVCSGSTNIPRSGASVPSFGAGLELAPETCTLSSASNLRVGRREGGAGDG